MRNRRRALEVLTALESGPKSMSGIHQRLCGDKKSLYPLVAELLRKGLVTRLPGRRHDPRGDPQAMPVTFYCLATDKPAAAPIPPEPEEDLPPVRRLTAENAGALRGDMARIRNNKRRGTPAGPTYCRGFAGWGGWRM
jgi:hypothetical protein